MQKQGETRPPANTSLCCASQPHKALIYYWILSKHPCSPDLIHCQPARFKPTADLQVISGLANNEVTYLKDVGRGRMACPFLMCSSSPGPCLHRI